MDRGTFRFFLIIIAVALFAGDPDLVDSLSMYLQSLANK